MTDNVNKKTGDKKTKRMLILLLLLIILIAIGIIIWAIFIRDNSLSPDYAALNDEKYARDIGDDGDDKLAQAEGGGAVSLTYSTDVTVDRSEEEATLMFANPTKSNQDMVVQIVVHDLVIAQSGRISPGKQVEKLDLSDGMADRLKKGGYNGNLTVLYYQPDTHEKTIVNTEIPVNITVR